MLDWLYKLLGSMLAWFSSITGSYALALLLYALLFKIVFLFFTIKQQKNQIKMAKLTPKIELIRAKYRGRTDQITMRKQQEEIMKLQQDEGYSPLSGCLPLLIQMPIIIFLYNVIRKPLSYIAKLGEDVIEIINTALGNSGSIDEILLAGQIRSVTDSGTIVAINNSLAEAGHNMTIWEIQEAVPNFNLWGLNLAEKPSLVNFSWLILIPILAAGFQWLSMFVSRKVSGNGAAQLQSADDQTQMSMRMMDLMMPAMTLFFTFSFSAMMGLYWIYQSIITIIQTLILAKLMPIPKYTEEELKAMQKARRAQQKAQNAIIKTQPKYKSLHYIDEDDYEELPEVKSKSKSSDSKSISSDKPEIKD